MARPLFGFDYIFSVYFYNCLVHKLTDDRKQERGEEYETVLSH